MMDERDIRGMILTLEKRKATVNDIKKAVRGKSISTGTSRLVYEFKPDPENYVAKIIRGRGNAFENIREWLIWYEVQFAGYEELMNWLCPIATIDNSGTVLIQRRATPGKRKDYPKRIPAFFMDLKLQNFGFLDGRFVCFDYGCVSISWALGQIDQTRYPKWWNVYKVPVRKTGSVPEKILKQLA